MWHLIKQHYVRVVSIALLAGSILILGLYQQEITNFFAQHFVIRDIKEPKIAAVATPSLYQWDEEKLLNMQGYSIQLLAAGDINKLHSFVDANNLAGSDYMFHSMYEGKDWYTLLYGNYPTYEAAKAKLAELPAAVKTLHPWVRSISSVRNAILSSQNIVQSSS